MTWRLDQIAPCFTTVVYGAPQPLAVNSTSPPYAGVWFTEQFLPLAPPANAQKAFAFRAQPFRQPHLTRNRVDPGTIAPHSDLRGPFATVSPTIWEHFSPTAA
jgi:hypothetical protein